MLYFRSHHPQPVHISRCPNPLFALPVSCVHASVLSSSLCLVLLLCCRWVGLCFYQMSAVVHCGFTKAFW